MHAESQPTRCGMVPGRCWTGARRRAHCPDSRNYAPSCNPVPRPNPNVGRGSSSKQEREATEYGPRRLLLVVITFQRVIRGAMGEFDAVLRATRNTRARSCTASWMRRASAIGAPGRVSRCTRAVAALARNTRGRGQGRYAVALGLSSLPAALRTESAAGVAI